MTRALHEMAVACACGVAAMAVMVGVPLVLKPAGSSVAAVVFPPGRDGLARVTAADDGLQVLGLRWGGRLVFVRSARADLFWQLIEHGAVIAFNAPLPPGCSER